MLAECKLLDLTSRALSRAAVRDTCKLVVVVDRHSTAEWPSPRVDGAHLDAGQSCHPPTTTDRPSDCDPFVMVWWSIICIDRPISKQHTTVQQRAAPTRTTPTCRTLTGQMAVPHSASVVGGRLPAFCQRNGRWRPTDAAYNALS